MFSGQAATVDLLQKRANRDMTSIFCRNLFIPQIFPLNFEMEVSVGGVFE